MITKCEGSGKNAVSSIRLLLAPENALNGEYIENLKKTVAESMSVNFQNKFIININFFSLILFKKRVKI